MVQVGMQKQAQYDQGVQKIQNYIDRVTGIELVKDSHKAMLQSKLNELGSKLKTVAAGDFSNQQLVNSVSGMTGQLIKDRDVQNAVYSTQLYKKQMQKAEEDSKKSGGANVYNRAEFLKNTQNWLNDGSVTSPYNVQYDDYTDVYKKLVDIGKTVGVDSTTTQNLFQTDAGGKPVMVNGKLQYNDVMVETLLKGKDKNKILEAFQAGLSPADYRQLAINGKYELQGRSVEELHGMLDDNFKSYQKSNLLQKQSIQDKIVDLKCGVFSPKEQPLVDDKIKELELSIVNLDNNLAKRTKALNQSKLENPDAIRSSIYTNNFLDSVSDALSEKETSAKYSKNPAVEVMFERERIETAKDAEARQQAEFKYRKQKDVVDRNDAMFKWKYEQGLIDENGRPTGGSQFASGKRDLPIDDVTNPAYYTSKFEDGLDADLNRKQGLYEKVAIAHWKASNANKGIFSDDQIKASIAGFAKKIGMSYNDYIILQGSKAMNAINGDKTTSFGPEFNDDVREINALDKTITNKLARQIQADKYVAEKAKAEGFAPFDYKAANLKPVTISLDLPTTLERGKYAGYKKATLVIPKEDLYKFARIADIGRIKSNKESEEIDSYKKSLNNKYGEVQADAIYKHLMGVGKWQGVGGGPNPIDQMLKAVDQ